MADCGAAGTTLDRVARAAGSSAASTGSGKQAVAQLLGHAGVASSSATHLLPLAPPSSLRVSQPPVHPAATSTTTASSSSSMDAAWATAQQMHPAVMQSSTAASWQPPQHQMHPPPPPHMMHPPHASYMMQQQQQQQFLMMQQMQQMNHLLRQQQQQQQQQQQNQTKQQTRPQGQGYSQEQAQSQVPVEEEGTQEDIQEQQRTVTPEDDVHTWHEGLEEEVAQGATMEELAAAWAQAEAEYYEDAVNVGSAVHPPEQPEDASLLYPYEFSTTSKTSPEELQSRDWMAEGVALFERGHTAQAIECFEQEVQHVHPDNAQAWFFLGKCHAENDQDRRAIACLERSVERDPYFTQALLALGVSYVNELHPGRALSSLKAWITHNPAYAGLELEEADDLYGATTSEDAASQESDFDQVQRLLLRALEFGSDERGEVYEALGVVYNVSRDYAAAVDAFNRALERRGSQDYSLWNKLGATLANSNKSEDALPAYHRALQLKPRYARAWLNLAISHSNLQDYDEAARCYLQTLSLNPSAVHCWSYLRIALSCSEQWDLIPLAAAQDLKAFREHFDFVMYDNPTPASK